MPQFRCHGIAITGGTGGRIRGTACSQNHPFGGNRFILSLHTGNLSVFRQNTSDPGSFYSHTPAAQLSLQAFQYRLGSVCHRKHAIAAFCFQRASVFFKKGHDTLRRKRRKGAEQKTSVPGSILQHLLGRAVIGHITATLSRNQQLFAETVIAFQQKHMVSLPCCGNGSKHTRRSAANDNAIVTHSPSTCFS